MASNNNDLQNNVIQRQRNNIVGTSDPRASDLFDIGQNNVKPGSLMPEGTGPKPTNSWDENYLLDNGEQPVMAFPYYTKFMPNGLNVSLPYLQTVRDDQGKIVAEVAPFVMNMNFSASELDGTDIRSIGERSEFGTTLQWNDAANNRSLTAPIVEGMPMASTKYKNFTPRLQTMQAILSVNGNTLPGSSIEGTRFEVALNNNQTWVIYSEYPVRLTWSNNNGVWQLQADQPYSGWIRAAILNDPMNNITNNADFLDSIAGCVHTSGYAEDTVQEGQIQTTMTWEYERFANDNNSHLATMALPWHHTLATEPVHEGMQAFTVRGKMKAIVGDKWTLSRPVRDIPWLECDNFDEFTPEQQQAILTALAAEPVGALNPSDTYFYGKALARVATVALIADLANNNDQKQTFLTALQTSLTPWILSKVNGAQDNQLVYDETWGGLVQKAALSDPNTDFGNGIYNDHHFHYGYFIHAAAVLQRYSPSFMNQEIPDSNGARYSDWFKLLAKDFANTCQNDPDFIHLRHQDRYRGYSSANGLVDLGDGRNQESVSEACNAYYALALFAETLGDDDLLNQAQALLDREIRGAQNFWQIRRENSDAYLPGVAKDFNYCAVNLWDGKIEDGTWFGNGTKGETHLIASCFPYTAMLRQIVDPTWLQENYNTFRYLAAGFPGELSSWRFTAVQTLALGVRPEDYDALWQWALEADPTTIDDGMTRSYLLFSVASGIQLAKKLQKVREQQQEVDTEAAQTTVLTKETDTKTEQSTVCVEESNTQTEQSTVSVKDIDTQVAQSTVFVKEEREVKSAHSSIDKPLTQEKSSNKSSREGCCFGFFQSAASLASQAAAVVVEEAVAIGSSVVRDYRWLAQEASQFIGGSTGEQATESKDATAPKSSIK